MIYLFIALYKLLLLHFDLTLTRNQMQKSYKKLTGNLQMVDTGVFFRHVFTENVTMSVIADVMDAHCGLAVSD